MKAVIIALTTDELKRIINRKNPILIRRTYPKSNPFQYTKFYIYLTKEKTTINNQKNTNHQIKKGKIIGEFNGGKIETPYLDLLAKWSGMSETSIIEYIYKKNTKAIYGIRINDLKIYDKPKELKDFNKNTPPNPWYYVEEL